MEEKEENGKSKESSNCINIGKEKKKIIEMNKDQTRICINVEFVMLCNYRASCKLWNFKSICTPFIIYLKIEINLLEIISRKD